AVGRLRDVPAGQARALANRSRAHPRGPKRRGAAGRTPAAHGRRRHAGVRHGEATSARLVGATDMTANADQFRYWNEDTGRAWIDYEEHTDVLTGPFGDE